MNPPEVEYMMLSGESGGVKTVAEFRTDVWGIRFRVVPYCPRTAHRTCAPVTAAEVPSKQEQS